MAALRDSHYIFTTSHNTAYAVRAWLPPNAHPNFAFAPLRQNCGLSADIIRHFDWRANTNFINTMIRLFITGGTIDVEKVEEGDKYIFDKTYLPQMLEQGRCKVDIKSQVLFLEDSIYTTDEDREKILQSCKDCTEDKIIITHGTDTMAETAQMLGKVIKDKTIVLLGAMVPFNQPKSDALFNLGCAISAVQSLPKGVYITMNGKIFSWDNVGKNKELGLFENIK